MINPAIALQTQAPQMADPMEMYGRAAQLKNLTQTNQMNDMKMQQERDRIENEKEQMRRTNAAFGVLESSAWDISSAQPAIMSIMGEQGFDFIDQWTKQSKAISELDDSKRTIAANNLTLIQKQIDEILSLPPEYQGAAYRQRIGQMVESGAIPQEVAQTLPQEWDPEWGMLSGDSIGRQLNLLKLGEQEAKTETAKVGLTAARRTLPDENTGLTPNQQAQMDKKTPGVDVPYPTEVEAQKTRMVVQQDRGKQTTEEKKFDYWEKNTTAMNRALAEANRTKIEWGEPLLLTPPGSELARLEATEEGPGPRRWGSGNRMPQWLALQYLENAGGDVDTAERDAMADGWDVRRY